MNRLRSILVAAALALAGMAPAMGADAAVLTFDYTLRFGAVPSDGTAPWLRAVFEDISPGVVRLTLTAPGLSTDTDGGQTPEFADEWWFNLNPALSADDVVFSNVSGQVATDILTPATASPGQLKPDGDGVYDIRFDFATKHLVNGESSVYDLTLAGLDALDFAFLSDPSGGQGTFFAAAHIQSTGPGNLGSDFVAPTPVPAPPTLALFLVPLLGWFVLASRRR